MEINSSYNNVGLMKIVIYTLKVSSIILIIGWLVGMLFVSRSGLVEEDAVEIFHYYDFHLSSSFLM